MSVLIRPLTHADLAQFPDDGKRYEIIEGELYVSPAPSRWHQRWLLWLSRTLYDAVETPGWGEVYIGPIDVKFSERDVVEPDLAVLRADRLHLFRGNTFHGPPDLVVEILSPSNRAYDEKIKAELYASAGVPELLIADPNGPRFRLYSLQDGRYALIEPDRAGRLKSAVVPGLVLDPAAFLAWLDDESGTR